MDLQIEDYGLILNELRLPWIGRRAADDRSADSTVIAVRCVKKLT